MSHRHLQWFQGCFVRQDNMNIYHRLHCVSSCPPSNSQAAECRVHDPTLFVPLLMVPNCYQAISKESSRQEQQGCSSIKLALSYIYPMCLVITYSEILPLAKQTADSIVEEFIFRVFWWHQHFLKHQMKTVRMCVFQVKNEFLTFSVHLCLNACILCNAYPT